MDVGVTHKLICHIKSLYRTTKYSVTVHAGFLVGVLRDMLSFGRPWYKFAF